VLASFSTIVAMLGLRLCSELKSAPASLIFWLGGLLAWATSAVIGTGLLKTDWSQAQTDMIVGGAWLGGILSVFVASGIYLRHIYIEAQRRFMMRNGMIREGKKWQMPKLSLRRKPKEEGLETERIVDEKTKRRQPAEQERETESSSSEAAIGKARRLPRISLPNIKMPSLRFPKWHSDPKLGPDFSDVDADTRLRDQGFDAPMPKKAGWFSKKSTLEKSVVEKSTAEQGKKTTSPVTNSTSSKFDVRSTTPHSSAARDSSADAPDFNEVASDKKRWWNVSRKGASPETTKASSQKPAVTNSKTVKPKKSWGLLPRGKPVSTSSDTSVKTPADKPARKVTKKWFGLLDGLKLKPPSESATSASNNSSGNNNKSQPISSSSKPIGPPSSSSAARYDPIPPVKSSPPIQVNRTASVEADDEEDEDQANRGMSRADRKRLRKQQQENRRAA
jgi:hypothetical protein